MKSIICLVICCLCTINHSHAASKKSDLTALAPLASNVFIPEEMPQSGYFTGVYKDPETDQDLIRYCIKTPTKLPDKRTLILIADFHGCGGNEESFKWVKTNYPEIDDQQLMWVGMKAQGRCWAGSDHDRISKCLAWVIASYPVDERRIFFRGYSSGAFLQNKYGNQRQDLVAGIIQYAGGGGVPKFSKDPENQATEYYIACGEKDKFHASACVPEVKSLAAGGYRHVFRSWNQHDHTSFFNQNDPQVASVSKDIMLWVFSIRHKTRGLYREDLAFLKSVKKKDDEEIWNDQATVDELIRIGGIEAGHFVGDALKSKNKDIVLKAIDACMHVNFSNSVSTALGKLFFKSKDSSVRAAAGKALARLSLWRHHVAQQALVGKLSDKKATEADKLIAINGIKPCIEFERYGTYYSDFDLYKGLVTALNDESESVRTAAFSILKTCHDNDYEYQASLDKKQRKTPVKHWQSWYGTFAKR